MRPVVLACAFPYEDVPNPATNLMYRNALRSDAEQTVARLRAGLEGVADERLAARTVGRYSAAHALHTVAESEQAAIDVVGSTHTGPLGRVLPGSTGERLLHGAPCAVAAGESAAPA